MGRVSRWRTVFLLSLVAVAVAGTDMAYGALQLRLSSDDGATWTQVTDNGLGDSVGDVGVLSYTAPIGGFSVTINTVSSKPIVGNDFERILENQSVNVFGKGRLIIEVTDTHFLLNSQLQTSYFISEVLTATPEKLTSAASYLDFDNHDFDGSPNPIDGYDRRIFNLTPGGTFFSTVQESFNFPSTDPFALAQRVVIDHGTVAQSTTYTMYSRVLNPEPASLIAWSFLGSVLGGLGWWRRKRLAA